MIAEFDLCKNSDAPFVIYPTFIVDRSRTEVTALHSWPAFETLEEGCYTGVRFPINIPGTLIPYPRYRLELLTEFTVFEPLKVTRSIKTVTENFSIIVPN